MLKQPVNPHNPDHCNRNRCLRLIFVVSFVLTSCVWPPAPPARKGAVPAHESATVEPQEEIGIATFLEGEVEVESPYASGKGLMLARVAQVGQRLRSMQSVRLGIRISVSAGGSVTIVCRNNRLMRIAGGSRVILQSCSGSSLPASSQRSVTHSGGTISVNDGSKRLIGESREKESDYGNIPIILSPRNTALIDLKPSIRWVSVKDAVEYLLTLSGPNVYSDVKLPAEGLDCKDDERAAPNLVCEALWPDAWLLARGKRYFLTVSARTSIASNLRPSEKSVLRTLDTESANTLQKDVDAIQTLDADDVTKNLLLAGSYAGRGVETSDAKQAVYVEAVPRYEWVAKAFPSPVVYVTLGDTYRAVDLQRYAFLAYKTSIQLMDQTQDDPAVRAAAEFGMGQVEYNRMNFKQAEPHYAKAVELYTSIGAKEELLAAQEGLVETRKRL